MKGRKNGNGGETGSEREEELVERSDFVKGRNERAEETREGEMDEREKEWKGKNERGREGNKR